MRTLMLIPLCAALICSSTNLAVANARRSSVEIVAPKPDEQVDRATRVVGRITIPGKPIVLVRPEGGDGHWWLQPPVEIGEQGYFRTSARFGSTKEAAGAKFTVVVAVLRNARELELFEGRESFAKLPRGILRSDEVAVTLKREIAGQGPANASILAPPTGATVGKVHEIRGQAPRNATPIVLIQAVQPNALWWAQAAPSMAQDGSFRVTARFGNGSTPAGMKFRVLVGLPASPEAVARMKVGASFKAIPEEIARSQEITVELGASEASPAP